MPQTGRSLSSSHVSKRVASLVDVEVGEAAWKQRSSEIWKIYAVWRSLWDHGPSRQGNGNGKWGEAPQDVLLHILSYVDLEDLGSVHLVSRSWCRAVRQGTHVLRPASLTVSCIQDSFPQVRVLHLTGHRIDTGKAKALGLCSGLEALHLHDTHFCPGEAFLELQHLQGLRVLELVDVDGPASWTLDSVIRGLTRLERLLAHKTQGGLNMPQLQQVTRLSRLRELDLRDRYHNHMLPGHTSLASLSSLTHLVLHRVGVTNGLLRAASELTQLEVLDVRDSFQVTDAGLPYLAKLTGLKHLDLCCMNQIRDEDLSNASLAVLSRLVLLTSLNLSGHVGISSQGLTSTSRLYRLQALDLSGVPVWMGGAEFLAQLTGLTRLDLSRTLLGPPQLGVLTNLTGLQSLSLASTLLDDDNVSVLAPLTGLTDLDIRYCPVHNVGVTELLSACPHLKVLLVEGCPISTLKILSLFWQYRNLRIWSEDEKWSWCKWRSMLEFTIMTHVSPHETRFRLLAQREDSLLGGLLLALLVATCSMVYFLVCGLMFVVVALGPIVVLAILVVLVALCALGCNYLRVFGITMRTWFTWMWLALSPPHEPDHDNMPPV